MRAISIDFTPFAVRLHVYSDLEFILGRTMPRQNIERRLREKTSVKDVIESCGIPHPEIDLILVNGEAVDFNFGVAGDAEIEVYPPGKQYPDFSDKRLQIPRLSRFLTDGHLDQLTRN